MSRLRLTLFGGLEVQRAPDGPLTVPTRKAQGLLAYLALSSGHVQPRDKLAALLWPDTSPGTARTALRQTLFVLRKALGPSAGTDLVMTGDAIGVAADAVDTDVAAFERALADATPPALEMAAGLYRGDLLAGLALAAPPFEEWLMSERERLRELALEAFARLLAHQRAAGATAAAIQSALQLLALDPLQEAVHRALMRLYVQIARRDTALRQYQDCVDLLHRELGVEPEAETKGLYQEILRSRPARESVASISLGPVGTPLADKTARLGAGTAYDWRRIVEGRLIPVFGERRVSDIDVEAVEGFIASLKRGEAATPPAPDTTDRRRHPRAPTKLSNRRVNIIVKVMRQSLDRAVSKGWLADNPARKIELLREDKPEIDPFSVAEVKTFIADGLQDDEHRRYFRVAFFTGLRPGEQIGLQWDDIDWQRWMIRVRRSIGRFGKGPTKTIESRRDVEILPIVEQALRNQHSANCGVAPWVFANRDGGSLDITNLRERVWRPAIARAKVRDRTLYQTRHTFATLMLEAGESPGWVARQLGYTNVEMVYRRYHKFIPNLRGRDGAHAARWLATKGL